MMTASRVLPCFSLIAFSRVDQRKWRRPNIDDALHFSTNVQLVSRHSGVIYNPHKHGPIFAPFRSESGGDDGP